MVDSIFVSGIDASSSGGGCAAMFRGSLVILLRITVAATLSSHKSSRRLLGAEAFIQGPQLPTNIVSCHRRARSPCRTRLIKSHVHSRTFSCLPEVTSPWPPSYNLQLSRRRLSVRESKTARFVVEQAQEESAADGGIGVSRYPRPRWLIKARNATSPPRSRVARPIEAAGAGGSVEQRRIRQLRQSRLRGPRSQNEKQDQRCKKRSRRRRSSTSASASAAATAAAVRAWDREHGWEAADELSYEQPVKRLERREERPFVIVCDAESVSHPQLLECIDAIEQPGIRDVGLIYANWKLHTDWRSPLHPCSKADHFRTAQLDPLPPGMEPAGEDRRTADLMKIASSETFRGFDFCLISVTESMGSLARRLKAEGRHVVGVGLRQAPEAFCRECDSFLYMDPANRYELLMDEGLVISVALCMALAAAGQEKCDWVRMKTLVNSLHSWDLGLEDPNWYGYTDYDVMIEEMLLYVHGVEDTSGEVVLRVPPESAGKVQAGLEDVAYYLHKKWVSFTHDPQMNAILLSCIPACLYAVAMARGQVKEAMKRFRKRRWPEASQPETTR